MTMEPIRLVVPAVGEDELREIAEVLASGYLTQGPKVAEFEQAVAAWVGSRHAVATTSATTALHLALAALKIGPGDEVLVPDFTFPATANVVIQQGARPVLVDIDRATFTIDPEDLARRVTTRSRAIIPVHAFGLAANMDAVNDVALRHGLKVVEDAACAIGSTYLGRPCGSLGTAGCFSFHPRKAITTGEGGMVTTDDDALAERLRLLRSHGGIRSGGRFTFEAAGFNYRLSDVLAAMGVAQMRKLDAFVAEKQRLAGLYRDGLRTLEGVRPPATPEGYGHVYQSYVVVLDERIDRDGVIEAMRGQAIETTIGTYALHAEPFFARTYGLRPGELPESFRAYRQTLTLPLYPGLRDSAVERVVSALAAAVAVPPHHRS
jgi:Predicted pyridoxal phosphate-dependent enzyme apparently involved in regulation of cell wall biogenesis